MPHNAIFVDSSNHFDVRTLTDGDYTPGPAQSLVRVLYSGINPADAKHPQVMGINNTVPGYDYCGTVLATGAACAFAPGQTIAGFNHTTLGRRTSAGAHQDLLVADDDTAFAVPPHLPPAHAAALSVVVRTAGDALVNQLRLPSPVHPGAGAGTGALLVWGGASAVGLAVVQLARAAGVRPIVATASPARHALLKTLGATAVFDYAAPDVVAAVRAYMATEHAGTPLAKIFDAVSIPAAGARPHTTDQAAACASDPAAADVCTTIPWRDYKMPLASCEKLFECVFPDGTRQRLEPRVADAERSKQVLAWCVANYGSAFELPEVRVVDGGRALECVLEAGRGAVGSFGKVVIEHPITG